MDIYTILKNRSKELKITQEEVSFQVGRHNANFWESIKQNRIKFCDFLKVCEILKLDLNLKEIKPE